MTMILSQNQIMSKNLSKNQHIFEPYTLETNSTVQVDFEILYEIY